MDDVWNAAPGAASDAAPKEEGTAADGTTDAGAPPADEEPVAPGSGAGASPPGGDGASGAPPSGGADGERPGVREQLGRVQAAARLLVDAHLALLRAELAVIGEQVKQIAAFVGGIVALALYAILLLAIGGTLFLGEWIFGSIGWGVMHGVLLAIGVIVTLALLIIDAPRPLITRPLAWGLVAGVGVTLVLGLNVPHNLSVWVADAVIANVAPTLDPQYAPAVVAMVFFAVVIGIVGLIVGARGQGALGAVSGLIVGALLGALIGILFGGLVFGWRVAAAIGLTVGLFAWIALMGWRASKANLDPQARFEKLWPRETYETALETRTWLEQEWTKRLPRRDSK